VALSGEKVAAVEAECFDSDAEFTWFRDWDWVVSEFESVWGPRGMQDDGFHRGHFFPFNRVLSVGFYLKGVVGIYYMICGEMDDGS
jgi:hypothetical protein